MFNDDESKKPPSAAIDFRRALGCICYLIYTRPDLVFAFGVLSTVSAPSRAIPDAPTPTHRRGLARTIRYISTSRDLGLFFLAGVPFSCISLLKVSARSKPRSGFNKTLIYI